MTWFAVSSSHDLAAHDVVARLAVSSSHDLAAHDVVARLAVLAGALAVGPASLHVTSEMEHGFQWEKPDAASAMGWKHDT